MELLPLRHRSPLGDQGGTGSEVRVRDSAGQRKGIHHRDGLAQHSCAKAQSPFWNSRRALTLEVEGCHRCAVHLANLQMHLLVAERGERV